MKSSFRSSTAASASRSIQDAESITIDKSASSSNFPAPSRLSALANQTRMNTAARSKSTPLVSSSADIFKFFSEHSPTDRKAGLLLHADWHDWMIAAAPEKNTHARGTASRRLKIFLNANTLGARALDLSSLGLTSLPRLPPMINAHLNVSGNPLPALPVLPEGLQRLNVSATKLDRLPALPESLTILEADEATIQRSEEHWESLQKESKSAEQKNEATVQLDRLNRLKRETESRLDLGTGKEAGI